MPGGRPRGRLPRSSMRDRHQGDRHRGQPRHGSPPNGIGLGDSGGTAARCVDREGRAQLASLPLAPRAAEGEEERDRADHAAVAGWGARKNPAQVAGASRAHRRDPGEKWRRERPGRGALSTSTVALSMVLAFIEHVAGAPTMLSLEVLTMAGRLAREMGTPLEAVAIGPNGAGAAGILSSYGVSALHVADDLRLASYAPVAWVHTIAELADRPSAAFVLGTATHRGG